MTALPLEPSWVYEGTFWFGVVVGYTMCGVSLAVVVWVGRKLGRIVEVTERSEWSQGR